jgi:hypothetical protein
MSKTVDGFKIALFLICLLLAVSSSQAIQEAFDGPTALPGAQRSAKTLQIGLVVDWNASSVPLEFLEGIRRAFGERLYWELLDRLAANPLQAKSAASGEVAARDAVEWLREHLSLELSASLSQDSHIQREFFSVAVDRARRALEVQVAQRVYAARMQLHAALEAEDRDKLGLNLARIPEAWALLLCGEERLYFSDASMLSRLKEHLQTCRARFQNMTKKPASSLDAWRRHWLPGDTAFGNDHVRNSYPEPPWNAHQVAQPQRGPVTLVILYADVFRDASFAHFHRAFRESAKSGNLFYILRARSAMHCDAAVQSNMTRSPGEIPLNGYTVEVALKNTEYLALDARPNETLWTRNREDDAGSTLATSGFVSTDIQDLNRTELEKTLDALLMRRVWATAALEKQEPMAKQASLADPSGTLLSCIERLANDLPSFGSALFHEARMAPSLMPSLAKAQKVLVGSAQNLSRLHPELQWSTLPSVLYLNGRRVTPQTRAVAHCVSTIGAANLAAEFLRSRLCALTFGEESHGASLVKRLLTHDPESEDETFAADVRLYIPELLDCPWPGIRDQNDTRNRLLLLRLNDIERDRKYGHWNASFSALLPAADRGGQPELRRNAFRLVAFIDPGSGIGLDVAAQLVRWVQHRQPLLPFQISVVIVPQPDKEPKNASESSSEGTLRRTRMERRASSTSFGHRLYHWWRSIASGTAASTSEPVSILMGRAVFYFQHVWRSRRATALFLSELHAMVQREHPLAGLLQLQMLMGRSNMLDLPPIPPKPEQIQQAFVQTIRRMQRGSPAAQSPLVTSPEDAFQVFVQGRLSWRHRLSRGWQRFRFQHEGASEVAMTARSRGSAQGASEAIAETRRWAARIGLPQDMSAILVLNGKLLGDVSSGQTDASQVLEHLRLEVRRLAELVRAGLAPDERCTDHVVYEITTKGPGNASLYPRCIFSGPETCKPLVRVPALEPQLLAVSQQHQGDGPLQPNRGGGSGARSLALFWDAMVAAHQSGNETNSNLWRLRYRYARTGPRDDPDAKSDVPMTVWLFLDLNSERGLSFLRDTLRVLEHSEEPEQVSPETDLWPTSIRVALFHTGTQAGHHAQSLLQLWESDTLSNRSRGRLIDHTLVEAIEGIRHQPERPASPEPGLRTQPYTRHWLRLFYQNWAIGRNNQGLVVNGRLYRTDRHTVWEQHSALLLRATLQKEAARAAALLHRLRLGQQRVNVAVSQETLWSPADSLILATMIMDTLDAQCTTPTLPGQPASAGMPLTLVHRLQAMLPALRYRSEKAVTSERIPSYLQAEGIFAPFTAADSELVALLRRLLQETLHADLDLVLNPRLQWQGDDGRALQPRYTRTHLATGLDDVLAPVSEQRVVFDQLAEYRIHNVRVQTPSSWLVVTHEAEMDPDNIALAQWGAPGIPQNRSIVYKLAGVLVEGQVVDQRSGSYPAGLGLRMEAAAGGRLLRDSRQDRTGHGETVVMGSLGYFQLATRPGIWRLVVAPDQRSRHGHTAVKIADAVIPSLPSSRIDAIGSANISEYIASLDGTDHFVIESLDGLHVVLHTSCEPTPSGLVALTELLKRVPMVAGPWHRGLMPQPDQSTGRSAVVPGNESAQIHIFSIASGHVYERLLRIMMLSAVRATPQHRCKFWLIGNFLSPSFRAQLPRLARRIGFDYELVHYAWPSWLRAQHDKQRLIWAYKILFLDVLFPLGLKRIIFIDSDQVVRGDLSELWQMPLSSNAVYGFVPFCEDRPEMNPYRFWKRGFWAKHLQGRPYHISALFVVDLERFRSHQAGDILRALYQRLSADPNSLANLDQDLPNYASVPLNDDFMTTQTHEPLVPLHSLPSEWLWCESWCSDERKARAKTIDLCNNPNTHESKLESARRIIPHWDDLDTEATAAATLTDDQDWERFRARPSHPQAPERHDELR